MSENRHNPCKGILLDVQQLLTEMEWGRGNTVCQCPFCDKLRDVFPEWKHRSGCKQQSMLRRIDAVLRQMKGER